MKWQKLLPAGLLAVLLLCGAALSVCGGELTEAELTGHGTVLSRADTATVDFGAESRGDTRASALEQSDALLRQLSRAAREFGKVSESSLYTYEDPATGVWTVNRWLTLTTERTDRLEELSGLLVDSGASSVGGSRSSLLDPSAAEQKALEAAIADAMEKARALGLELSPDGLTDSGAWSYGEGGSVRTEATVTLRFRRRE